MKNYHSKKLTKKQAEVYLLPAGHSAILGVGPFIIGGADWHVRTLGVMCIVISAASLVAYKTRKTNFITHLLIPKLHYGIKK